MFWKYVLWNLNRKQCTNYISEICWTVNWFCENASQSSLMKYPSESRLKVRLTIDAQLLLRDDARSGGKVIKAFFFFIYLVIINILYFKGNVFSCCSSSAAPPSRWGNAHRFWNGMDLSLLVKDYIPNIVPLTPATPPLPPSSPASPRYRPYPPTLRQNLPLN